MQATGIPKVGARAIITWPDGKIQTVTILDPYATGAQVQFDDGQVMDLTIQDVTFAPAPEGANTLAARWLLMSANLIWYIPLSAAVVFYLAIPNAESGYHNVALTFSRFTWAIFISPSAYLFFSSVLASVFLPLQLLLLIPAFFDPSNSGYGRRYVVSFGLIAGIAVSCVIFQVVIWGSFPLPTDQDGSIHLRMIPFLPWPEAPLFG